jgi:hypothetical protein
MESNFYTTPRHIVVRESFLHLARAIYEEMAKGKHRERRQRQADTVALPRRTRLRQTL